MRKYGGVGTLISSSPTTVSCSIILHE